MVVMVLMLKRLLRKSCDGCVYRDCCDFEAPCEYYDSGRTVLDNSERYEERRKREFYADFETYFVESTDGEDYYY